jgi:hypothetical protein
VSLRPPKPYAALSTLQQDQVLLIRRGEEQAMIFDDWRGTPFRDFGGPRDIQTRTKTNREPGRV